MNRNIITFLLFNITIGTLIASTSNHWFLIWIGLETNTISIIPIIASIQNRRNIEAAVKYFIIQALAAAIILNSVLINVWNNGSWLINTNINNFSSLTITAALLLKLSIAPFHLWFPDIINGINLTNGLIITTWQKIAPTIITINIINNNNNFFLLSCCLLSVLIGAWGGLNQTQTRKILAFSSITHISWIITIAIFNPNISLIMLATYIIVNTTIFVNLINNNTTNIANSSKNRLINPWNASSTVLAILSLGGLPPLTGFINKFLGLNTLIENNAFILTLPLIISSLVSLFFYLRIAFNTNMVSFPQNSLSFLNIRNSNNTMANATVNLISIAGIIILPLILTLN
uniref:NADH dehydrogenase subunit 2 n=1 Tax=Poliometra prolixa TaxID=1320728 RepID=UPI0021B66BD4|nr:NADH dehydrogenase subunit 2 [Poliometra prolixa]UWI54389.1 NADH dehydrogenase subunit 2 [Poliometra prolixa]